MFDYLQFVQKIIDMSEGRTGALVICNKDGRIEYCKSWESHRKSFSKRHLASLVGRHILDIYPNLTEETSTIMRVLRTGIPVVNQQQVLAMNDGQLLAFVSNTIPFVIDGELMGAIDYTVSAADFGSESIPGSGTTLYVLDDIITRDPAMLALKSRIQLVADSDSPVLIYGETGTGKELIAESLHTSGKRRKGPFVSQNCSAIPPSLMEGIFFGSEKGSFTGAESKKGLFEMADGGTLFLDEISAMEMTLQAKLLKAVEEKKVRRLGGASDQRFDVRVVCASNIVPEALVRQKMLREDLYYRIGVVRLDIPPLRERRDDIPLLIQHFIATFNRKMSREVQGLSELMLQLFMASDWPGNVRELKNVIERDFNLLDDDTVIIGTTPALDVSGNPVKVNGGNIRDQKLSPLSVLTQVFEDHEKKPKNPHLQEELFSRAALARQLSGEGVDLREILDEFEGYVISQAIRQERQLNKAARKLSISPQRLQYRLNRLGLRLDKFKNFD